MFFCILISMFMRMHSVILCKYLNVSHDSQFMCFIFVMDFYSSLRTIEDLHIFYDI